MIAGHTGPAVTPARARRSGLSMRGTVVATLAAAALAVPSSVAADPTEPAGSGPDAKPSTAPSSPVPVAPDAGARPVPSGALPVARGVLPRPAHLRTASGPTAVPTDPMLARIAREEAAVGLLSERLNEAVAELDARKAAQKTADDTLAAAAAWHDKAQERADEWARNAFIDAAESPSGFPFSPPRPAGEDDAAPAEDAPVDELTAADRTHAEAAKAAMVAGLAVLAQDRTVNGLRQQLTARGAALATLRAAYAERLATAERQRDARNSVLAAQFLRDAKALPGTAARVAVEYALRQLGKPYEWGAEGPDTFDCSGLSQTAYAQAGVRLPRTARPQYRATPTVPISALLPGDLLFFATDKGNWDTIHHMGIYLGRGQMVHAPTTGDVVKISPIWWEEFFAATRVVPGRAGTPKPVTAPSEPRPSKPSPKPSPSTPPRSAAPSRPPQSTSPSPSGSASPSESSPSPSPSGSTSPGLLPGLLGTTSSTPSSTP